MSAVMILFAFSLSLVINFVEKKIHPDKHKEELNDPTDGYAMEEAE